MHDDERPRFFGQAGERTDRFRPRIVAAARVDQCGIRVEFFDQPPAFAGVRRGTDDLDACVGAEPPDERVAGGIVVVDEDELQRVDRALTLHVVMLTAGHQGRDGPNVGKSSADGPCELIKRPLSLRT